MLKKEVNVVSMKMKRFKRVLCSCFLLLVLLVVSSASEGAIHVTKGGSGNKSGDSWANAMGVVEFRAALEAGTKGEYWLAKGTYTPTGGTDRDKSFVLKNNIALYGGFAGTETDRDERDWEANVTILSGAIGGGLRSKNVVRAENAFSTAILDGMTITGGETTQGGGGMLIIHSSPTVRNCTFTGNKADIGGGMGIMLGSPTLTNCTFSKNVADDSAGGMYLGFGSPTLTNCTFSENKAGAGGGIGMEGSSNPTLTNCTFTGNEAGVGGGMVIADNSNPTLTNCTFSENVATYGGGMFLSSSDPTLTNCTFSGNGATSGGGMDIASGSKPTLMNCTFSENEANYIGRGVSIRDGSDPTVTNTIFWGAGSVVGQVFVQQGNPTITYSVVDTAVFPGNGNTGTDPMLAPLADNGGPTQTCALLDGSSAIDSGTNTGAPSTDQRGVSRPQGSGYDIGAYEKEQTPVPPKPGSSGGGGCSTGPSSPWVLALLAPLASLAMRKGSVRRGR
ncbi:MAG: hypothetical protein BWY99_01431 [Synergistetes bacterium ADurb.BinA166]|jgi:parallel beta-helix repeat protein|nr:MAG: hypothetical protein BWY99_01431 [Synergistetes bacterium ADurb.BinA166]